MPLLLAALGLFALSPLARGEVEEGKARIVPWSGYWWPLFEGRMAAPSGPLDKYEQFLNKKGAVAWEQQAHPRSRAYKWEGYCHAWSAAALMEREPTTPLNTRTPRGNLYLSVADQKGLLTAAHARDVANIIGRRYSGPEYDPKNMAPDVLWKNLKLHIQQKGLPLVLDLDPSAQVWNYPVYAYRVDYRPTGAAAGEYQGQMTIWAADDVVPPDFVGTKVAKRTYQFTCRMRNGSVVMGSAQWVGASVRDHPDFGWYPYVIRPENPHLKYDTVRQMLGLAPRSSTEDAVNLPVPVAEPASPPQPANATIPPAPAIPNAPPANAVPMGVSPTELLTFFVHQTKKTSAFHCNVLLDKGPKATYQVGEKYFLRGESHRAGYIYLFHIDPDGKAQLLFPIPGQDNRVPEKKLFEIGSARDVAKFVCNEPVGYHRIKTLITVRPLVLTGVDLSSPQQAQQAQQGQARPFGLNTVLQEDIQKTLVEVQMEKKTPAQVRELTGADPAKFLPEFSYDEQFFVVQANKPVAPPNGKAKARTVPQP
jgi:hypothetical protein